MHPTGGKRVGGVWDVAAVGGVRSTGGGGVWAGRVLGGRQGERGAKGICGVGGTRAAPTTENAGGDAQEDSKRAGFVNGWTKVNQARSGLERNQGMIARMRLTVGLGELRGLLQGRMSWRRLPR